MNIIMKNSDQNDTIVFADESKSETPLKKKQNGKFKLLIVDDEKQVHTMTKLVLSDYSYMGRTLEFYSAFSAKEAEQLKELERLVGKTLPTITTEGFSYNPTLKPSKKIKKENREAKELAEKMMNRDKKQEKKRKTTKRDHYKSPKNKRHF